MNGESTLYADDLRAICIVFSVSPIMFKVLISELGGKDNEKGFINSIITYAFVGGCSCWHNQRKCGRG